MWSAGPPEPKSTLGGEGARFLDEERELQRAKSYARRQPEPEVRRLLAAACGVRSAGDLMLSCRALLMWPAPDPLVEPGEGLPLAVPFRF